MRLFVAINFTEEMKDALCETIADLRDAARRGRYTARENLHLTLVFIGETNRADDALAVMEDVATEAFPEPILISLSEAGVFGGKGGDLHWVGVENTPALKTLADRLAAGLRAEGFAMEKRRFTPHITIGREVVLDRAISQRGERSEGVPDAVIRVRPARMQADRISLMRSDRVHGRMVYTEIGSVYCDHERN